MCFSCVFLTLEFLDVASPEAKGYWKVRMEDGTGKAFRPAGQLNTEVTRAKE